MARTLLIAPFFLICALSACALDTAPVCWEDQLRGMGYLIMHLSTINAINGINLDRQQALELRKMARDIEGSAPWIPPLKGRYRADLGEVRDTYLEVEKLLLAGQEIPGALGARVGKARGIETAVIRASLAKPVTGASSCVRCHGDPGTADLRTAVLAAPTSLPAAAKPASYEVFLAHHAGLFGVGGSLKLLGATDKVDRLLKPEQKQALTGFACCLTPPKNMTDPVRAGQAADGGKEIELMRSIRHMSDTQWQITKAIGSGWVDRLVVLKSPGATPQQMAKIRENITGVLEKSRALSESDFELDKAKLAGELRTAFGGSSRDSSERDRKSSTAMFLLTPGSTQAYDALIKRLDSSK